MRKLFFALVLAAIVFGLAEAASWMMLRFLAQRPIGAAVFIVRRPQPRPLRELLREAVSDPLFDREIGWARTKASQTVFPNGVTYTFLDDGSRLSGLTNGPVGIAFFGCSGTMGLEVGDADSFPARVSTLARVQVKNWGVPGYGVDQALQLFERRYPKGTPRPPVAFLGMGTEGINRNMSAWRLFYTGENLLKPRMQLAPDGLRPENPVLSHAERYFQATDREILRDLAPCDYWLTARLGPWQVIKPGVEFPFSWNVLKAAGYLAGKARSPLAFPDRPNQSPFNLYDQKESFETLCRIVDRFFADCAEGGTRGYMVLITAEFYLDAAMGRLESNTLRLKKGRPRRLDDHLIEYLESRGYPYVDTLPVFQRVWKEEGRSDSMFCQYQHPSPRANKLIAEAIVDRLRRDGVRFTEAGAVDRAPVAIRRP